MSDIRLLIVDDEERFLQTYKKLLERRGIRTSTCTNGADALQILKETDFDVVLLDIKMPGIDGIEVLKQIKRDYPELEVVLLTGHISIETEREGLEAGASDFLLKPSTLSEVKAKVEEAFERRQAKQRRASEAGGDGSERCSRTTADQGNQEPSWRKE